MNPTEVWQIEGVAIGAPDMVADSLADRVIDIQDSLPAGDIAQQSTLEDVEHGVEEADQHFHNIERWWGSNGAATETNAIAATVTTPFQVTSGNDDWGTAVPICGTGDNPVLSEQTTFDAHRLLVTDLDNETDPWRVRIIWGTGTSAAAISADQWSEIMVITNAIPGNRAGGVPCEVRMPPIDVGTKMWAQSWNNTNNEVLSFYWGAHGYPYSH